MRACASPSSQVPLTEIGKLQVKRVMFASGFGASVCAAGAPTARRQETIVAAAAYLPVGVRASYFEH